MHILQAFPPRIIILYVIKQLKILCFLLCNSSLLSHPFLLLHWYLLFTSLLYLSVSLSVSFSLSLSLSLSASPCLSLSLSLSISFSLYLCLFICLSLSLSLCLSVCLSISLSLSHPVSTFYVSSDLHFLIYIFCIFTLSFLNIPISPSQCSLQKSYSVVSPTSVYNGYHLSTR